MTFNDLLYGILVLLVLSMGLALIRILEGPRFADRVVALDILAILAIGTIAVLAIITDAPFMLDVAMIIALTNFLTTIGFAYYIERSHFLDKQQSSTNPKDSPHDT